jgi:hypothetical protein
MINGKELCETITTIYPDIGACGIDVEVDYDGKKEAWMVDLPGYPPSADPSGN